MNEADVKRLIESAVKEATAPLHKRIAYTDAAALASAVLSATGLSEAQRGYVIESVLGTVDSPRELPVKEGALNAVALTESINAAAKAYVKTLPAGGRVAGLGGAPGLHAVPKPEEIAAREAARVADLKESEDIFAELLGDEKAAKIAAKGRAA